jgi:hypothetical protein
VCPAGTGDFVKIKKAGRFVRGCESNQWWMEQKLRNPDWWCSTTTSTIVVGMVCVVTERRGQTPTAKRVGLKYVQSPNLRGGPAKYGN